MTTGTILDIVVILLLVPTIVYAIILNKRLTALRRSREELSKVVNSFNEATMRAEAGIPKLKKATTEANQTLKDRVDKAQTLRDDLAFMIERAEELASRLEGAVRAARNEGVVTHGPAAQPANTYSPPTYSSNAAPAPRPLEAAPPARGYAVGNPGMSAVAPGTLTAATLAQTAAGFEETAAELRNALGAARAEARAAEARAGGPVGAAALGLSTPSPRPRAVNARDLKEGGLPPPKRTIGERPLAADRMSERGPERTMTTEMPVDEERSEAERELLKALQSAR